MLNQIKEQIQSGPKIKPRNKDIVFQGVRLRVYSISWFSYLTYLSLNTIRLWERNGIVPKPFFVLAGKNRWYSAAELLTYSNAIRQHYQGNRDLESLRVNLHNLNRQIRKRYLGLKPETKKNYSDICFALPDEKRLREQFFENAVNKKITKEHFWEVKQLLEERTDEANRQTDGEDKTPSNSETISGLPKRRSKLRH